MRDLQSYAEKCVKMLDALRIRYAIQMARDGNADVRYADARDGNGDAQDDFGADTRGDKTVGDNERIVTERNISYNQYMSMMALADPTRQSIHKIRKSFIWEGQYYELDQFIDPDPGFSILEMDSETKGEETKFPPFIKVIKDVTGKVKYYNINLAVKTLYD